jgi:hypothetical protein
LLEAIVGISFSCPCSLMTSTFFLPFKATIKSFESLGLSREFLGCLDANCKLV